MFGDRRAINRIFVDTMTQFAMYIYDYLSRVLQVRFAHALAYAHALTRFARSSNRLVIDKR